MTAGKYTRYAGGYELRYSAKGYPFYVRKKPLPRINDIILDSVVYIYSSKDDAERAKSPGGSGFLVCIPYEGYDNEGTLYVVTNRHVIYKAGTSPVIRLNTHKGEMDTLSTSQDDWVYHQDGDDLAVCEMDIDSAVFKYACLDTDVLLTQEYIEEHNIGPGDNVFMVGRFIDHEGRQRNTPSARFGHISMMPGEPVYNPERQLPQESFLVGHKKASLLNCFLLAGLAVPPCSSTFRSSSSVQAKKCQPRVRTVLGYWE